MNISALLTSAGINIGLLAQEHIKHQDSFSLERLVPSPSWIVKAWESSEEEILSIAGLDAVVFLRILVFSIRIFSVAAIICMCFVLPLNYHGQSLHRFYFKHIPSESLDVFTIANVKEGSKWLWVHCVALYIITCSACILLYFEYKSIAKMRLAHLIGSPPNPSHFTVLVRAIPKSDSESFSDSVKNFFTNYHSSSYLSHQMVFKTGKIQKLMNDAERIYKGIVLLKSNQLHPRCVPNKLTCGLCGMSDPIVIYSRKLESVERKARIGDSDSFSEPKECASAFVFFKTRYAAIVASQVQQSSNPMLWVTDLAPEPHDVYWSNLWLPYRQLWFRRIATLMAAVVFMFLFLIPVTFVQGLSQLEQLQQMFPFLKSILKKTFVSQIVTGYLPSVILQLFLYIVPPTMMLFSAIEGPISHSGRKKSACCKVLYFTIWNVFFVNVLSGSVISQLNVISSPKGIPTQLAKAVPRQATFFITYVLTSGWASLSSEVVQLFALILNSFKRVFCGGSYDSDSTPSFPYHTEVPKVLLFGLLGFTCSILAPLILPFLLVYFFLGYVVYRNQILNVYCSKYETGGQFWPIVHNTTVFSLILTQIIALGVFGIKHSPVASGFTIPLLLFTLLFNEYCRQRFSPIFHSYSAEVLIKMDREDEGSGRLDGILEQLQAAYCQPEMMVHDILDCEDGNSGGGESIRCSQELHKAFVHPALGRTSFSRLQQVLLWLSLLVTFQERNASK
ncbi:CSC1-like protein RXW8 isoform X2 [Amborella trichopoda]|uniref:CSC1-like protein RXW8 isoform X2 n=1 Tax=Amborella trichopoda TaxID=13333 RepID=UPI0009BD0B8F|nr:CSC1-like protein RXW8 isoform X2 [Amborella trichopoda]|eukprot:XP_020530029.1 CSC1-like protein RXW8 isoform X2 [Amborella trichopoda]